MKHESLSTSWEISCVALFFNLRKLGEFFRDNCHGLVETLPDVEPYEDLHVRGEY